MPRAQRLSESQDFGQPSRPNDWQDLRSELADLLERVENRMIPRGSAVVRHEPAEAEDRNRDALRSVRRAIDRVAERERGPANPQDMLQDAIREIRTRQSSVPEGQVRIPGVQPLDELVRAVGGIGGRIERLEAELRSQGGKSDVSEIAGQVNALAQVVDMLSRSVGETDQMQRLEAQVTSLAAAMAETPRIDLSGLNSRLADMSTTVEKLADLQINHVEREGKGSKENASLKKGMASIEESVRHVYDRIDAIEKNLTLSPADIERLTGEMAAFTRALREEEDGSQALVGMVETLGARLAEMEARGPDIAGLKADIGTLRSAVLAGMEPRFAAIEMQIEELGDRIGSDAARPDDTGMAGIEQQMSELVTRMDQTGAQLANLARLYTAAPEPEPAPDFTELAELTARRTSELIARTAQVPTAPNSDEMLDELERRMTRLFKAASRDKGSDPFIGMQDGIRRVDERLERLEASLGRMAAPAAPQAPVAAMALADMPVDTVPTPDAEPQAKPRIPEAYSPAADIMPANPSKEAPLVDKAFADAPDLGPVRAALEAKNGPRKPGKAEPARADTAKASGQPAPYDPSSAALPPRPQSSLDDATPPEPVEERAVAQPGGASDAAMQSTRNTFIEAARRAAQRHPTATRVTADSSSLIGKALSRFQPGAVADKPLAGDKPMPAEKPAKPTRSKKDTGAKTEKPAPVAVDEPIVAAEDTAKRLSAGEPAPSFLMRHRQVILLCATLVAVSLLTLNLIGQRMGEAAQASAAMDEISAPAVPDAVPEAVPEAIPDAMDDMVEPIGEQGDARTSPRIIDMVDSLATAAIDTTPNSFAAPANITLPPPLAAVETLANAPAAMPAPAFAPQPAAMPPEAVGPESLRKAAAEGDARAQFEVAAIYTEGRAVPEDLKEAAMWYERAASQGFAPAQYRLGNLYEAGKGVTKDAQQAKGWYQQAAEAGNRMSMHNLAALYAGGALGKQEFEAAAEWFEKAAIRGMTDSQFNLGMLYARGLGVPQNLEASYKWFSLAAIRGDADAGKARDDIARSLDAEAVSRLNAEIADFHPMSIDLAANFAPIGTWAADFDPGEKITKTDVVLSVQAALGRLGFDVGVPDGVAGPKTADAVKAFERATGMSESGAINPRLLAVLGSQPI